MKKFICAVLMCAAVLCGCTAGDVKKFLATDVTADKTEDADIKYTQDDFALYTGNNSSAPGSLLVGINMRDTALPTGDELFDRYYPALDLSFTDKSEPMHQYINADGEAVSMNMLTYISCKGSRQSVMTAKGIESTCFLNGGGENCSSEDDVIKAYGIDPNSEEYIEKLNDDDNVYSIKLYFKLHFDEDEMQQKIRDEEEKQERERENYNPKDAVVDTAYYDRIITEKGKTLSNEGAERSITFIISDGRVAGIQLAALQ